MSQQFPIVKSPGAGALRRPILSILDLARRIEEPEFSLLKTWFSVETRPVLRLVATETGWAQAITALQVSRESIEDQTLISVADRALDSEAIFNPLRSLRPGERK
jgi:hypothetical protein